MTEYINLELYKNLRIKVETDDYDYLKGLKDHLSDYVDNYHWMPAYRSGQWNGKMSLFSTATKSFPYGLLSNYLRWHKKNHPDKKINAESGISDLFKSRGFKPKYDLSLYPYPYQKEAIETLLNKTKGIARSATASGKSLIIAYIIKTIQENVNGKVIIIVPTISLTYQFYNDLVDYGFDENRLGIVYSKKREWDKEIISSTWQTLAKNHDKLPDFRTVIVDEVHQGKAHQIKKILSKTVNAEFRFGFTGTMPPNRLDKMNVMAYLGPVFRDYSSGELAKDGYISKCNVKMIEIEYLKEYTEDYTTTLDEVFSNTFRKEVIRDIVMNADSSVMILVGKVEKEGEQLQKYLSGTLTGKEVVFLSGRDKADIREYWRKECNSRDDIALIATYGIMSTGINIPSLKHVILASPFKSKIRVLQSIGRALRKHADKESGAYIYDICDKVKYLQKQIPIREKYYAMEMFNIENEYLKEKETVDFSRIV